MSADLTADEYPFHCLTADQFENLASDLVHHVYGVPLLKFSAGKDGGRDAAARNVPLRFSRDGPLVHQNVIVQAKHTREPSAKLDGKVSSGVFEKEAPKVKKLVDGKELDTYFVVTNYSIPANRWSDLTDKFKKQGAEHVVIIGRGTLFSLISNNKDLTAIIPLKYGIGDLTRRNNYQMRKQSLAQIEYYEGELLKSFIETKAYEETLKSVANDRHNVIILDGPQSGKSTILRKLGSDVERSTTYDFSECVCATFDDFKALWNPSKKQVFIVDDAFGNPEFNEGEFLVWNRRCNSLGAATHSNNPSSFVIASRKEVYQCALSKANNDFKNVLAKAIQINLEEDTFKLNLETKKNILLKHIDEGSNETKIKDHLKSILRGTNLESIVSGDYPLFLRAAARIALKTYTENADLSFDWVRDFFKEHGTSLSATEGSSTRDQPISLPKAYKVWTKGGKKKVRVSARTFQELKRKGGQKLGFKVAEVTELDGTQVDDETLPHLDPDKPLYFYEEEEFYVDSPESEDGDCTAHIDIRHDLISARKENISPLDQQTSLTKEEKERITTSTVQNIKSTRPLSPHSSRSNAYCDRLTAITGAVPKKVRNGSVIITVECPSLEALNKLWEEYMSGRLKEMAEECLISEEIKSTQGFQEIKIETSIDEQDYNKCRDLLTRKDPLYTFNEFDEAVFIWIAANVVTEKFKIPLLSVGIAQVAEPQLVSRHENSHFAVLVEHNRDSAKRVEMEMAKETFKKVKTKLEEAAKHVRTDTLLLVTNQDISSTQKEEMTRLFAKAGSVIRQLCVLDRHEMLEIIEKSHELHASVQQEWICKQIQQDHDEVEMLQKRTTPELKKEGPVIKSEDKHKIKEEKKALDPTKVKVKQEDSGGKTVLNFHASFSTELPSVKGLAQSKQAHEEPDMYSSSRKRKKELGEDTLQASTSKAGSSSEPKKKITRKNIPKAKEGPWQESTAPWLVTPLEKTQAWKCAGCKKKLNGSGASVTKLCVRHKEHDWRKGMKFSKTFKADLRTYHLDRACIARRHDDFDSPRHVVVAGNKVANDVVLSEKQQNQAEEILGKIISARK